jgi:hypothetical protein
MDDPIQAVEEMFEQAARSCLRLIVTRPLKPKEYRVLSKWMFGCLNQRYTIRSRVQDRGVRELAKALRFIAQACEVLLELDENSRED